MNRDHDGPFMGAVFLFKGGNQMEKDLLDLLARPRAEMTPDGGGCGCVEAPEGGCVGHEGCGCNSFGISDYPLAMVYAPCQTFRALYDPATALSRGTLFCELDMPFGCCPGVSCSTPITGQD